jgi:hypothetical protein
MIDHFLVRRAGFPLALLADLRSADAWTLAERAAEMADAAEACRDVLLHDAFPAEVRRLAERADRAGLRALSRLRRDVGRRAAAGCTPPAGSSPGFAAACDAWRGAARRAGAAAAAVEVAAAGDRERRAAALLAIGARDDVRQAVFLMSPSFSEALERMLAGRRSPGPAFEHRLFLFCQRLAAKNETNSSFGPLVYGRVQDGAGDLALGPELAGGVTFRRAACAFWAVAALSESAARDPELRAHLPARRLQVSWVEEGRAHLPDGRAVALPPELADLYEAVVAGRPLPAAAGPALVRLERLGLVRRDLEPPSTAADPLADFLARLPDVPAAGRWLEAGERLRRCAEQFATDTLPVRQAALAEAERTFAMATGREPRRHPGQAYADRTLLFEDCLGDGHPCRLPAAEAARLVAELTPVLDLGAAHGALALEGHRACALATIRDLGGRARYLAFAEALRERAAGELERGLEPARRLTEELARLVGERDDGRAAGLEVAEIARLATPPRRPLFASPDVMLERRPGRPPRFVLGEVHPYVYAWGSQGLFAPDPDCLQAAFTADLRPWGGPRMAHVLRRRSHKGLVTPSFPGRFVEVTGRAGDGGRAVAVADLWVEESEDGATLVGPDGPLVLYTGEGDHPHLRAFAPPQVELPAVRLGARTPRIEVGDVVVQRARWDLAPELLDEVVAAGTPARLLLAVARAARRWGWPRRAFVRSPHEPKPIYVDLEIPYAQQELRRLAALGPIAITEMLPDEPDLWLERGAGRYTSELRIALVAG